MGMTFSKPPPRKNPASRRTITKPAEKYDIGPDPSSPRRRRPTLVSEIDVGTMAIALRAIRTCLRENLVPEHRVEVWKRAEFSIWNSANLAWEYGTNLTTDEVRLLAPLKNRAIRRCGYCGSVDGKQNPSDDTEGE